MAKGYHSVNLLRPRSILLDELVDWALTIGRLLVIITELVALSMFLYRFALDRQIIDLKDKISQERQIVEVFKDRESTFRTVQSKLDSTSKMVDEQERQQKLLKTITSSVPSDSSLNSVTIATTSANIYIASQNISSLKNYVEILKKDKQFQSVNIVLVDTNPSKAQVSLSLRADLNTK